MDLYFITFLGLEDVINTEPYLNYLNSLEEIHPEIFKHSDTEQALAHIGNESCNQNTVTH